MHYSRMISTIDSHTGGEGTRLVTAGLPPIPGETMFEKMRFAEQQLGWLPGWLLLEPRGHRNLYGAILTPPCSPGAQAGVIFINNHGFEPMCGHAVIGVVTSLLETGYLAPGEDGQVTLDTPAGLIRADANIEDGHVRSVSFENIPAFVYRLDMPLALEDGQVILVDIAFGGNFFALVDAGQLGLELTPEHSSRLVSLGMDILRRINAQVSLHHPLLPEIDRIIDLRFTQAGGDRLADSRNVVVLGDCMLDRSPCGTGTCAEMAVRFARGQLEQGERFVTESILGTRFTGCVLGKTRVGDGQASFPAVFPQVTGSAFLTGFHQFVLQENDPFPQGFVLD